MQWHSLEEVRQTCQHSENISIARWRQGYSTSDSTSRTKVRKCTEILMYLQQREVSPREGHYCSVRTFRKTTGGEHHQQETKVWGATCCHSFCCCYLNIFLYNIFWSYSLPSPNFSHPLHLPSHPTFYFFLSHCLCLSLYLPVSLTPTLSKKKKTLKIKTNRDKHIKTKVYKSKQNYGVHFVFFNYFWA